MLVKTVIIIIQKIMFVSRKSVQLVDVIHMLIGLIDIIASHTRQKVRKNMKLVIDIPNNVYDHACSRSEDSSDEYAAMRAIAKCIPLPKGHGRIVDVDKFLKRVKKDREHEAYMHSWTADNVLERLDSWYAPTIIEADKE